MQNVSLETSGTRSARRIRIRALVVAAHTLVGAALLGSALTASAQLTAEPTASPTAPKQMPATTMAPIPIPEIAQRAEQVAMLLQSAEEPADPRMEDVDAQLAAAGEWIRARLVPTVQALTSSPSGNVLTNLTDSWNLMRSRLSALNDALTRRATLIQRRVDELDVMQATWTATRENARQVGAPPTVLERIDDTMMAIAAARRDAHARLARVLGFQDRAVKDIARCDDVLGRIMQVSHGPQAALLSRDALPIWSRGARTLASTSLGPRLREAVVDRVELIRDFVATQLARVPVHIALLVIVFVLARRARRAAARADAGSSEAAAAQVFERPFASALVVALIATLWIYPHQPRVVIDTVGLLVLLPAVRIAHRLAPTVVIPAIDVLAGFFVVDRIRTVSSNVPALEQWVFLLEMMLGIVFLGLVVRSELLLRGSGNAATLRWQRVIAWALWSALFVLVVAVVADALGYMRLARLLGSEVLTSSYVGLVLYAGVRVSEGLVAYALAASPLRSLFLVQQHRALLHHRLTLGLRAFCIATWAYLTLDGLGAMGSIWSAGAAVLNARYVRGSVSLSLGDVAAFALTVWAAFLVSAFVRFVLREDVYARIRLPRGAAYAVSTIVHYVLVLTGFIFAVAALGIDLNRITILAGAFGVGVGIGLQSIVANFVSGLVLLLERRLHVGDSVQLGTLEGEIREIGSRASTIRTWDGADVIVPNATLTSERVVNWTLSDRLRRVDLDVGVAYAADPDRVLEILKNVAKSRPKALSNPGVVAVCTGFGDSALKFQLRVWTRLDDADSLLSELAIAVHRALSAAKIDIPFPQHDVHIRNGSDGR